MDLVKEIETLKEERQAVILAHFYQEDTVQDIADFTGDSFALSRYAAETKAKVVVLAGVRFMAESACILAPDKTVLLPDSHAGCSLADSINICGLRKEKDKYPDAAVVSYINTPAAVKAESDICCTSSNAVAVVRSLPHRRIVFVPDRNLAAYVAGLTDKEIIPWNGCCNVHDNVTLEEIDKAREAYPQAEILVHPECRPEVVREADFAGSTGAIIRYVREGSAKEYVIGTEKGVFYRLRRDNPDKRFYLLSPALVCPDMKLTSLEKIARCLREMHPVVKVAEDIRHRAYRALKRMLAANPG